MKIKRVTKTSGMVENTEEMPNNKLLDQTFAREMVDAVDISPK